MLRLVLIILGVAAVFVGAMGFRGQITTSRPKHFFWDMKYQNKFVGQGASSFFADGRSMRPPVPGTIPFSGLNYFTDAGHLVARDEFIPEADPTYFLGHANRHIEKIEKVQVPKIGPDGKTVLGEDKKPIFETKEEKRIDWDWVRRIPKRALDQHAGDWDRFLARGKERYIINCVPCHGLSGQGGSGDLAHGIVGKRGMQGIASYHDDRLRNLDDGELFNTITHGKGQMSAYGHQVNVADRWAIIGYIRVLQYSRKFDDLELVRKQLAGSK